MNTRHIRTRKSALAIAATLALLPMHSAQALTCNFGPAAGNWNLAANWSCAAVPGAADTANVAITSVVTINDARNVGTLVNDGVVNHQGSSITGGNIGGTGAFRPNASSANFLDGVTLSGVLDMATAQGFERITNGLTLNSGTINIGATSVFSPQGNQTFGGTGQIVFVGNNANNRFNVEAGNLTLASGITVRGEGGTIGLQAFVGGPATLTNHGTIQADVAGGVLNLAVNGLTTNHGTLAAVNGGTLNLNSALAAAPGSQILAGAGSVINQNAITITGAANITGAGSFRPNASGANFLDGVTLSGVLDMATAQGLERITNGLTLNSGTINIGATSVFAPQGNQTIGGTGQIVFVGNNANNRFNLEAGNLTLASGITVRGEGGTIGLQAFVSGPATLTNHGTIQADVAGGVLNLAVNGLTTNHGTLAAVNGGTLNLNSAIAAVPGSQILAGAGSVINQNAITISGEVNITASGSFRPNASSANFLDGVTLSGVLDMATAQGLERITNGLTLSNGTINIGATSVFAPQGNQTIGGTGQIVFVGNSASNRFNLEAGNLTLASGITVRGESGTIGQQAFVGGPATLTNHGSIQTDVAGGVLNLTVNGLTTNHGTLAAVNGGTLNLNSAIAAVPGSQILAGAGSVINQNAITITGAANITGAGSFRPNASAANFLDGVTLSGVLDMTAAQGIERVTNGLTLSNGTINIGATSLFAPQGDQTIGGNGTIVFVGNNANNRFNLEAGNLTLASGITVRGEGGTIGTQSFVAGPASLTNNGTINADAGGTIGININGAFINHGTLRAQNGTLTIADNLTGTGTLRADTAGVLNLANGGNAQGTLTMGAAGSVLNVGTGNLTLNTDYTNTAAGTGNSFNRRAGVSGAGQIVAGGNAAQAITGVLVSNGATGNATLTIFGNQRVNNGIAVFYDIANTGTTGPTLRGAIQTNVNGANISDPRLSGGGVTAANYNAGAPGNNSGGNLVLFVPTVAGVNAPLVGQVLNLRSNFENIADQKLNIVLAPGSTAFNMAVGSATPSAVTVANQRVGGSTTSALTVANTAVAGAFSEDLNASFGASTGSAGGAGSITGLLAGANNSASMAVNVNTASAGAKTGTVTINYDTAGTVNGVSNGMSAATTNSPQIITVNGNVYRLAQANAIAAVSFGNVLANSVQTRTLTISNEATPDGFSEALNAAFGAVGGTNAASFSGAGAINGLVAGGSDNTTMVVTLNTSATGTKTANIQVLLNSNGTAIGNGLGITALPTQVINLDGVITGVVGNLASAGLNPTTVNFGKFREGAPNQTQQLTVSNLTVGPGEGLNASFGASSGGASNNAGSITSLATGGVNNTSMSVSLSGLASAGPKSGTQALNFVSDGTFNAGVVTPLPAQSVSLSAEVYRLASASATSAVNLAARRVGEAAASGALSLNNSAATDGFSEGLRGSLGAAPAGFAVSGAASTALIAAGANEARTVSLSTANAGSFSGNLTIALVSNGAGTSGFGDAALADKTVALSGKVYTPAVGQSATPTLDFGVVRVGDTVSARNITINNTAAVTALNDTLAATLSGAAAPFSGGNVAGIAAQGSGQIGVGLGTSAAGVFNVNANLSFLSHNPDMADASAGANAGVNLLATINNLANADFDLLSGLGVLSQNGSDYVLDLGTINLGSSVLSRLHLDNDVLGPADDLRGNFDLSAADDFSYLGWDTPVGPLAAGQATGELEIDYMASTLGPFQDSIVFNGRGTNASDPAGLAQTRRLIIRANVIDPNGNPVPEPGSLALMLAAAVAGLIARRRRVH